MKIPRTLHILLDATAIAGLRHYTTKRIALQPPKKWDEDSVQEFEQRVKQFIDVIEQMDTRMWEYLSDKEKERARKLARRYPQYVAYINPENLLKWLASDVPIAYGIIKGHPKGEEWLKLTLGRFVQEMMGYRVEVVEASKKPTAKEEST